MGIPNNGPCVESFRCCMVTDWAKIRLGPLSFWSLSNSSFSRSKVDDYSNLRKDASFLCKTRIPMLFDCSYLICWGFQGMFYLWLGVATIQILRFLTIFQPFLWMAYTIYSISRHAQISPWISVYVPIPLAKYQNTCWILDTCPTICFFSWWMYDFYQWNHN